MSTAPDIICLGEPMVEFVRMDDGVTYRRGIGGDTSNAAVAAARQGASTGYVTALGADRFGDAIVDFWAGEGVDASAVIRNDDAPTGIYFIDPDPAGRFFTYYRAGSAASLLAPDSLPTDYLTAAKILHVSGITLAVSESLRASALAAMQAMAEAGRTVSLDTNLRLKLWSAEQARRVIHAAMAHAKIAITSIDDSLSLTGLTNPEEIVKTYRALGPEIVIVTMGADGVCLGFGDTISSLPAIPVEPVDSTGAGDSFSGAFLAYWLETGDPLEAARRATRVAAKVVSDYGATAPIPKREEIV